MCTSLQELQIRLLPTILILLFQESGYKNTFFFLKISTCKAQAALQVPATFIIAIKQVGSKQPAVLAYIWQVCSTLVRKKNHRIQVLYHVDGSKVPKVEFLSVLLL